MDPFESPMMDSIDRTEEAVSRVPPLEDSADTEMEQDGATPAQIVDVSTPMDVRRASTNTLVAEQELVDKEDDESEEPTRDMEVYGLASGSNGRNCMSHEICGKKVMVGSVMRLKKCVVKNAFDEHEEAIACIMVEDGMETCRVGFAPRFLIGTKQMDNNLNKHIMVTELYADSSDSAKKRKSFRNVGVAGVVFLSEVNQIE